MDLHHGDAYSVIKDLQNNHVYVDHIITDPPYNISQDNQLHTLSHGNRQGVDFGTWDKGFDVLSWIGDYVNILHKNGSMIIFNSYRNISHIVDALESHNMVVKDILVWQKSNPMPRNTDRRYVQDMEFAIWAVRKNAKWTFNKPVDKKYVRAFYQSAIVAGKERTAHPTQKSLKLMCEILEIHTHKNDIILDPFMGSGTTGVACKTLNRSFIGIEKDAQYYKIAHSRIHTDLF